MEILIISLIFSIIPISWVVIWKTQAPNMPFREAWKDWENYEL